MPRSTVVRSAPVIQKVSREPLTVSNPIFHRSIWEHLATSERHCLQIQSLIFSFIIFGSRFMHQQPFSLLRSHKNLLWQILHDKCLTVFFIKLSNPYFIYSQKVPAIYRGYSKGIGRQKENINWISRKLRRFNLWDIQCRKA